GDANLLRALAVSDVLDQTRTRVSGVNGVASVEVVLGRHDRDALDRERGVVVAVVAQRGVDLGNANQVTAPQEVTGDNSLRHLDGNVVAPRANVECHVTSPVRS